MVMKIATNAVALSTAPAELSFTRFCKTTIKLIASNAPAGTGVTNAPTRPNTSPKNPNNRTAIEIGWPLES